ncbi:hypothetical protein MKZ08_08250 [Viridibacillus sp. FSL R5-0477]|uniref:Glyoxalase-like domain-containing protein n=1 Tax=Viridibacillus arenosi FSL R5-213 TaxID=1227360 RepID=W4EVD5_9BACL|nr:MULTISPECIES: hypothetical protein [Viridibacillus]ETT84214.1 hypothetical protein C176_12638 [Viridibacillus arenosi FSL R5-213]OMC79266.1 hypothetical protein BK130_18945 [Viridibacillus sp. FSL H8-0123]OMC89993.1 hypothetical protein BK137_14690 [Viridibacillus arenosi]
MKIDHLVINIDSKYQEEGEQVTAIRSIGLPYNPNKGKGTKGFKVSNIWIGKEYFEMVNLLREDGGGWKEEWVNAYNQGERGLICLMIDVADIDLLCEDMQSKGISITNPESIKIKFLFNLFSKTLPWQNSYLNFFEGVPLQIGFQQMINQKTRDFMGKYMVPNALENNIEGINRIKISGNFSNNDFELIKKVFDFVMITEDSLQIRLQHSQEIIFEKAKEYKVMVSLKGKYNKLKVENCWIENTKISLE